MKDQNGFEHALISGRESVAEFLRRRSSLDRDLAEIAQLHPDNPTTREALIAARLGQGKYRADLLAL
ncbi:hypothetical protein [Paraburkholderia caribensis]|uniref:hypothetical protein n=1 Tax=Paraburkholderia caribensis TaxID=75105 RepID=UPI001CB1A043|nr:hypothetical protein [Paraburkholderia caribensis]CAG9250815.1 hypothetical protein PCAR4_290038 [Paraburkholderia caribensis]